MIAEVNRMAVSIAANRQARSAAPSRDDA